MNILVRNLDREATEEALTALFRPFGKISSVTIVLDKLTGLSKGFGFVEMPDQAEGNAAIKALHFTKVLKEKIRVKETVPRDGAGSLSEHIEQQAAIDKAAATQSISPVARLAPFRRLPAGRQGQSSGKPSFSRQTGGQASGKPSFSARGGQASGRPSFSAGRPEYRPRRERPFGQSTSPRVYGGQSSGKTSFSARGGHTSGRPSFSAGRPEYRPRRERPFGQSTSPRTYGGQASGKPSFSARGGQASGMPSFSAGRPEYRPRRERPFGQFSSPYRHDSHAVSGLATSHHTSPGPATRAGKPSFSVRGGQASGKYGSGARRERPPAGFPKRNSKTSFFAPRGGSKRRK